MHKSIMRSKRMHSKSMRSKSKSMRSKSKTTKKSMRSKSKSKSKSTKKSMRSKTKKSKRKSTRRKMRGGNSFFQPAPTPTPGAAYFAGSSDKLPHGTHYSPSAVGIPAGSFDPAIRAGAWPTQAAGGKSMRMRSRNMHGMLNRSMGMSRSMGMGRSMGMSRSMGRSRSMHGGGVSSFVSSILPDEIVNIGRSIPASLGHMVDKFNGTISMPSSLVYPTQQPHVYQGSGSTAAPQMPPIDIMSEFNKANLSAPSV